MVLCGDARLVQESQMSEKEQESRSSERLAVVAAVLNIGAALVRLATELFT